MRSRPLSPSLGIVVALALAGCAGASRIIPDPVITPPRTERPPLGPEEERAWSEAIARFHEAAGSGLSEAECADVIATLERVGSTVAARAAEATYMIGVAHARCGDRSQAQAFYRRALELDERLCGARVASGLAHYEAGRTAEARSELERAVREDARCVEGYVNLAILQRADPSERAEALSNLRRALAIRADFLPAFDQMALLYLVQARARGDGTADRQMLDLAAVVCRQAQLIDPGYAPIYNTWALIDLARGEIVGALAKLDRATTLDPDFFEAWMNFGELTLGFRGYDDALRAFTRASELRPSSYDAHVGLGAALRGLRRVDDAQRAYEHAIELDEQRPEAHFNLALLYHDYRDGAEPTLRQAQHHYRQFAERARGRAGFADALESVTRECPPEATEGSRRRRARQRSTCQPGRIAAIDLAIDLAHQLERERASE